MRNMGKRLVANNLALLMGGQQHNQSYNKPGTQWIAPKKTAAATKAQHIPTEPIALQNKFSALTPENPTADIRQKPHQGASKQPNSGEDQSGHTQGQKPRNVHWRNKQTHKRPGIGYGRQNNQQHWNTHQGSRSQSRRHERAPRFQAKRWQTHGPTPQDSKDTGEWRGNQDWERDHAKPANVSPPEPTLHQSEEITRQQPPLQDEGRLSKDLQTLQSLLTATLSCLQDKFNAPSKETHTNSHTPLETIYHQGPTSGYTSPVTNKLLTATWAGPPNQTTTGGPNALPLAAQSAHPNWQQPLQRMWMQGPWGHM